MRKLTISKSWIWWSKVGIAASAALLLDTCTPLPSVIDQIKTLGELRVVTRDSPLAFYRDADDLPAGPEYDLARRFADQLGVKLRITPLSSYAEIYEALTSGRAHLAAAALKVPAKPIAGMEFGPIYQRVKEHLVYRRGGVRPGSLADIGNSDLEIAAGSAHSKNLRAARDALPNLAWVENASTDSQVLLDGVADGSIDYTIADSTEFALAHDAHPDLRIAFDFPGSQSLAWAASSRDPGFLVDMNVFFSRLEFRRRAGRHRQTLLWPFGRFAIRRCPRLPAATCRAACRSIRSGSRRRPRKAARTGACSLPSATRNRSGIPSAASASGAKGLMQLTVDSAHARRMSPIPPMRGRASSAAPVTSGRSTRRFPAHVPEPDRTWFALAAYNIGYGHLEDARVLAQKAGRDPDSWQDVREFLPLLEQEFWYTQTENGYARGSEPVRYVDNVRDYRDMLEWAWGSSGAVAQLAARARRIPAAVRCIRRCTLPRRHRGDASIWVLAASRPRPRMLRPSDPRRRTPPSKFGHSWRRRCTSRTAPR